MENPHHFEQHKVFFGICVQCGRGKFDYQYHFAEQVNTTVSGQQGMIEAAIRAGYSPVAAQPTPTDDRIAMLERQVAFLTGYVKALVRNVWSPLEAARLEAEMEEASKP